MSQDVKTYSFGIGSGKMPTLPLLMPELTLPLIFQCGVHTLAVVLVDKAQYMR